MTKKRLTLAIVVAGAWLSIVSTASAQIASYVDEDGKTVFVNGDSPVPHRSSTIKAPARAIQAQVPLQGLSQGANVPASDSENVAQAFPPLPAATAEEPSAVPSDRLDRIVRAAAERHKVDPALVKAVISTESGWNPRAVSNKGAVGLMQLIPGTAQRYGVGNPYDPAQNVEGGTTYLKWLLDRYDGDLTKSLAAYNAGERSVDRSGGVPAYPETQHYVQKVTDAYFRTGSGRNVALWEPPKPLVRRERDSSGRVIFTNE